VIGAVGLWIFECFFIMTLGEKHLFTTRFALEDRDWARAISEHTGLPLAEEVLE
jgi:hypothetical protein